MKIFQKDKPINAAQLYMTANVNMGQKPEPLSVSVCICRISPLNAPNVGDTICEYLLVFLNIMAKVYDWLILW